MTQDFTHIQPQTSQSSETPLRQPSVEELRTLNTVGLISYLLHLFVAITAVIPGIQMSVAVLLVSLILDLVYRKEAEGTWHASHFSWRIRSVIIAGVLYLVTAPLFLLLVFPGMIAWLIISMWFLYRILCGFMAMNKGLPMEQS